MVPCLSNLSLWFKEVYRYRLCNSIAEYNWYMCARWKTFTEIFFVCWFQWKFCSKLHLLLSYDSSDYKLSSFFFFGSMSSYFSLQKIIALSFEILFLLMYLNVIYPQICWMLMLHFPLWSIINLWGQWFLIQIPVSSFRTIFQFGTGLTYKWHVMVSNRDACLGSSR